MPARPGSPLKSDFVPRISEDSIRQVVEANDIVEVVGSYFPLKRAGGSFRALCPFHNEKTPSFHVNPARQAFHCFGCGAGGGVIRFVMDYEHLDFPSAIRRLAQRAGITLIEESGGPTEADSGRRERARLLELHAVAAKWFHSLLLKSPAAETARTYLKNRGINSRIAKDWMLGYAPTDVTDIPRMAAGEKFSADEIVQAGLAVRDDHRPDRLIGRFRDRMMIPIRNDYGEVIAFSGRLLDPEAKTAKYINSPETPLFVKGRVLFGLDKTKRDLIAAGRAIVCEGQLDLITAYENDIRNVIAPQGTAFTPQQAKLLRRFVDTVILCFDADAAGEKAVGRSLPALFGEGLAVRAATMPPGLDPDSLIRSNGPEAFRNRIEQSSDAVHFLLEQKINRMKPDDSRAKSRVVESMAAVLQTLSDPVARETSINRTAARLGIGAETLAAAIKKVRAQPQYEPPQDDSAHAEQEQPVKLDHVTQLICAIALTDEKSRVWLASLKKPSLTEINQQLHIVEELVKLTYHADNPSSVAAAVASLPPSLEKALAALDTSRLPKNPLQVIQETIQGLQRQHLTKRIEALNTRLRDGVTAAEELVAIQKEILDLNARLQDVARPFASENHA